MKLAIMQPYLFPYIGYFQMIKAVDKFVFYDDVNFIKQGWINRNRILLHSRDFMFTVPLEKANSFCLIKDTLINKRLYESWKFKFTQTISQNYKKAPYFDDTFRVITNVLNQNTTSISELSIESIKQVSEYLELNTLFIKSSEVYNNRGLERQERLIAICKSENASHYVNAIGGQELYTKESFEKENIKLNFIKPLPIEYKQFNNEFLPWLSIIDVLMFNSVEEIHNMLNNFELY